MPATPALQRRAGEVRGMWAVAARTPGLVTRGMARRAVGTMGVPQLQYLLLSCAHAWRLVQVCGERACRAAIEQEVVSV